MREVNFSIPTANKASVGITTALYDRRALDCTSTLPLINSLNNLAYLTTSSARIRDILTVDGGVERLVCILKEGRSKDVMDVWKWNLAFQCVVNIGVRGSENVRTRVVEADIVPVIATILDNYIKVIEKCRERAEASLRQNSARLGGGKHHSRSGDRLGSSTGQRSERSRRPIPPPIEIPQPFSHGQNEAQPTNINSAPFVLTSAPERTQFPRHHHHHHHYRSHEARAQVYGTGAAMERPHIAGPPLVTAIPPETRDTFGIRPVRDADRLPSMVPGPIVGEVVSQPESPTTPSAPAPIEVSLPATRPRRRPSIRHQLSNSGDSDDQADEIIADSAAGEPINEPIVGIQNDTMMNDIGDQELGTEDGAVGIATANVVDSDPTDAETFNITHRSTIDGSIVNPTAPPAPGAIGFPQTQTPVNLVNPTPQPLPVPWLPRFGQHDRSTAAALVGQMPRDEDVLMSLQLLAYVSKYCNLRAYFQNSHLVPRLKLKDEVLEGGSPAENTPQDDIDSDEEFLQEDDYNIFPLVEKFTVRHFSQDMQYWAGVVMRNLCRKDDARGGVRQCAYYKCGRWEEYARQFAKCRRCRRTKYCSKDCQKSAWVYHRHWCVAAAQQQ